MSIDTSNGELIVSEKLSGQVAERLLQHLDAETSTFTAMLAAVRGVHEAMVKLDNELLKESLAAEIRELDSVLTLQQKRSDLRDELARVLENGPDDITLRRLVSFTTGSLRESIEQVWKSLSTMASELQRLNRLNAAMIGQSMAIARGVVERLTGTQATSESYSADGSRSTSHVGSIVQWGV
jgi:flagellar biosynthesis/type III secretory pathway chaperone